jgi:thiamine biosynthesis lipoprotein
MGTLFTITLYAPDQSIAQTAAEAAFKRIAVLDDVMSDYKADSELMRLCDRPFGTPVMVSVDLFEVLEQSQKYARLSDGAFDVTVGPFVRLWRSARRRHLLPTPEQISVARQAVGYQKLRLDNSAKTVTLLAPNMKLDLGGIGKGFAADKALAVLKSRGVNRALVAASGDIAIGDPPPGALGWKVGVPGMDGDSGTNAAFVVLKNAGISTSGDAEQFLEIGGTRYSHIVNPGTGLGLTNRIQDTIIGPNATTTDGLDTTVNLLGPKKGLALVESLPGTAARVSTRDNSRVHTVYSKRWNEIAAGPQ